jgi:hypothetical protein
MQRKTSCGDICLFHCRSSKLKRLYDIIAVSFLRSVAVSIRRTSRKSNWEAFVVVVANFPFPVLIAVSPAPSWGCGFHNLDFERPIRQIDFRSDISSNIDLNVFRAERRSEVEDVISVDEVDLVSSIDWFTDYVEAVLASASCDIITATSGPKLVVAFHIYNSVGSFATIENIIALATLESVVA